MAIALDASAESGNVQTSPSTLSISLTTTGTNSVIAIGVATRDGAAVTGITVDGAAASLVTTKAGTNCACELWAYKGAAAGAHTIVVTFGTAPSRAWAAAIALSGASQGTQPNANGKDSSTSSLSASGTTTVDQCWGVDIAAWDSVSSATPGASQTKQQDSDVAFLYGAMSTKGPLSVGANAMAWTWGTGANGASIGAFFAPFTATDDGDAVAMLPSAMARAACPARP